MKKNDLVIAIYFLNQKAIENDFLNKILKFSTNQIHTLFNTPPNRFSYSYFHKNKLYNKDVKYTKLNEQKMYKNINGSTHVGIELAIVPKDFKFRISDTDISFLYSPQDEFTNYSSLKLQMDCDKIKDRMQSGDVEKLVEELVSMLSDNGCKISYGFAFSMPRIKQPKAYATGIASGRLTEEEKELVHHFGNNKNKCGERIWDVFWCNIFNSKHLSGSGVINDIENIIGKDCLNKHGDEVIMCTIPIDILEIENQLTEYNNYRNQLRQVLKKYNLLM
ncbi:hypothetical protein [Marinifilum sp. D737]|uniref:hypothetical protein n=1 Tax=Marinifilum sp. D737 TaxID=2969628 RepID=UPI0022742DAA|nr:hypothetical protein [Marinifilum sp. D737]MCY1636740.1 hypothetical protein [Marinifilum sp. D737]